jgi:hypothetical protein
MFQDSHCLEAILAPNGGDIEHAGKFASRPESGKGCGWEIFAGSEILSTCALLSPYPREYGFYPIVDIFFFLY